MSPDANNSKSNRYDWSYWAERVLGDLDTLSKDIEKLKRKIEELRIEIAVLKTKMYVVVASISIAITIAGNFLIKWVLK